MVVNHKTLKEHLAHARRNRPYGTTYEPKPVKEEPEKKPAKKKEPKEPTNDNLQVD